MARAIRSINSLLYDKNENIPNINRQFADNSPKIFFKKLVQNHFPKVVFDSQIFRKLSENSPRILRKIIAHEFIKSIFPSFIIFRSFPRLRQFCQTSVFSFVWQLNPSGSMELSCSMISQSNCAKAGQDEYRIFLNRSRLWIEDAEISWKKNWSRPWIEAAVANSAQLKF